MRLKAIDNEREFDWGKTSADYAVYRSGYPDSFFDVLAALGVGRPKQTILDLGTGTGVLARAFAKRGAVVTAIDIAPNQIATAAALAKNEGVAVTLRVGAAEAIDLPEASFDVVSAGQSWMYFDPSAMVPKVLRLLKPEGCLALTHLQWLPRRDAIAQQTEALVLKHNPDWKGANYAGDMPSSFPWSQAHFDLRAFVTINQPLRFTRDAWRGRIRACRGVGATLSAADVERFDTEHQELLEAIAADSFEVQHQMTVHVFAKPSSAC